MDAIEFSDGNASAFGKDNDLNTQSIVAMPLNAPGIPNGSVRPCAKPLHATAKASSQAEKPAKRSALMLKSPSLLDWYHILRAHHRWTVFQAIRYALWLAR
jgi:hypothetical protein